MNGFTKFHTFDDVASYVILTSPHSFCSDLTQNSGRHCDRFAGLALDLVSNTLTSLKINHVTHKSYSFRGDYRRGEDMNRIQSRRFKKTYRQVLTDIIRRRLKGKICFNVDVHSFPEIGEGIELYLLNEGGRSLDYEKSLASFLRTELKVKVPIKDGPTRCRMSGSPLCQSNDIQNEFRADGIGSILIEFRELKRGENSVLYNAALGVTCSKVAEWLMGYIQSLKTRVCVNWKVNSIKKPKKKRIGGMPKSPNFTTLPSHKDHLCVIQ